MRLVKITGKSNEMVHPKHLINYKIWFADKLNKKDFVLDVGCGNGFTLIRLKSKIAKAIGVDVNPDLIKIANNLVQKRKAKNLRFIIMNANKRLPFKNKTFDKVICIDVLEHLEKRNFAIKEIARVLKNNGTLFLVTDNPDTSWKKLQKSVGVFYYADKDHKYEYTKSEIIGLLRRNQFDVISIDYITYDTPLKGLIDLVGGVSLAIYKELRHLREEMVKKFPQETTGFRIEAKKL